MLIRQQPCNKRAGTVTALDVAFGKELGVGVQGGDPRYAQVAGQSARRRNLLARLQTALENHRAKRVINLPMQRHRVFSIDRNDRRQRALELASHRGFPIVVAISFWPNPATIADHFRYSCLYRNFFDKASSGGVTNRALIRSAP